MVPMITQAQDYLLTAVSMARTARVSEADFTSYATSVTQGDMSTVGTVLNWNNYVDMAWAEGQNSTPPADASDFLNCLSDFYEQLDGGIGVESVRARGRSGAF
jgi:hypothetical protein